MTLVDDLLEADLDVVATLTTADHTLLAPSAPIAGLGYGVSIEHGAVPTGPLVVLESDGGFDDDLAEAFDAAAHPRAGAGSSTGGQFVSASQGSSSSSAQQDKKKPEDATKKLSGTAAYDAANEWVYSYLEYTDDAKAGATFRARRHSANVVDIDFVVLYNDGTMSVDTARVTQTALGPIVGPVHKGHQLASKRVKAPKHLNPKTLKVREATVDVLSAINPGGTYDQPLRRAANRADRRRQQQRRQGSSASSAFNAKHPRARAGSPTGGQFIKAGDSGPAAQGAQRRLKGKLTADSIRAYQRRNGLQEDGVIGRQTAHTLLGHQGKLAVGALTAKQSRALARQGKRSRHRDAADDLADRALRAAARVLDRASSCAAGAS